jgi:hypothetical protein
VLGDIAGLAADARMYQMNPEERTMGNYALSALGVLPFVPSVSAVKTAGKGVKTAAKELSDLAPKVSGTLKEAQDLLGITPEAQAAWRASRTGSKRTRVPEVKSAANSLRLGDISTDEYQAIVRQFMPIKPLGAVQNVPTFENIALSLSKDPNKSAGIVGVNVDIPDGTRIASRLDIPAYQNYDTWVVSLHDGTKKGGNAVGYGQTAVLNNVNFESSAKGALNIASEALKPSGEKYDKSTIARMYGDWANHSAEDVQRAATSILEDGDPDWVEIGMNPDRHSYFYRKSDGAPVGSAEQVIQIGPLVLAKKVKTIAIDDPAHLVETPNGPRHYARGGLTQKYATGSEVSSTTADLIAQMDRVGATPNTRTPDPDPVKTESQNMLQRFTSLNTPKDMSLGETAADIGMGFLPGVGTAQGARDFERARRDEDILGMGLSAASMIPVAGVAVRAARSIGKASKAVDVLPILERQVNLERFMEGSNAPPVLYTGTSKDVDFDKMKIPRNGAWFTASPESASRYAVENDSRGLQHVPGTYSFTEVNTSSRVLPVHLSAKSPYIVTDAKAFNDELYALAGDNYRRGQGMVFDKLRAQGYDSVHFVDPKGKEDVWVALESPTQVKSAVGNRGTFDPTNPVITKADGGLIQKYATGSEVSSSAADLQAQMLAVGNMSNNKTPNAPTPNAPLAKEQTDSASMLDNLIRAYERNISKPMVGSLIDMTLGLGDLGQKGVKYLANRAGIETEPFAPTAPRMKEAAGVADYDPYTIGGIATNLLPFARGKQAIGGAAKTFASMFPNLGREALSYAGGEAGAAAAREVLPDSTAAQLLASVAGSVAGGVGGSPTMSNMAKVGDDVPPTDSAKMLNDLDNAGSPLAPQSDVPTIGATESVRPEITTTIGDRNRVGTTGKYVGAPEGVNSPQKLAAIIKSITNLTKEGEFGRFWYERSGRQILDVTGGNKEDAEKIIQAIAITSANTPVAGNFDFALQAYYQWKNGQPIKTGMYTTAMSKKLQKMFDGEDWAGRKTNNFYNNLMREVDPSKVQGVTTDLWMMRAFGFDKDAPTDAQYSFVENETKRIAQNLGWEPQQVQAAIWVALKSRMENAGVKSAVEAKSLKNGWLKYDADGERVILDKNKHAANWLDTAMKYSPNDADRKAAGFDYADAAKNNLAQISWETRPSRTSMHMPEIFDATPEVVQDFHVAMSKSILDDKGGDSIAKELGVLSPGDFEAPGYFEGLTSPGTQTLLTVPRAYGVTRRINEIKNQAKVEGWEKPVLDAALRKATYATEPAAKDLMLAYAAVRGILFKQDGVGLHRPSFIEGLSRPKANGIEIDIGRPLTADETTRLAQLVANNAGHTEFNPIGSANGVRFINFDYVKTDNAQFQKIINNALKENVFDNGEVVNAKMFGADTDYLGNNWTENLNGESYMDSGILAGRPDLQRKIRDIVNRLAPRVSAVEEEFSNRHGWTRNRELNRAYETTDQDPIGIAPSTLPVEEGIGSLPTKKLEGQSANTDGTALTPVDTPDKARGGSVTKKAKGGNAERVYNDRKYI